MLYQMLVPFIIHARSTTAVFSQTHRLIRIPSSLRKSTPQNFRSLCLSRTTFRSFLQSQFSRSAARWAIPEKEAFPIVDAIQRFDYLVIYERKLRIFTDHRNLMFIFDTLVPLKQRTLDKLYRWSLKLNTVDYVIEHIPGHYNV